MRSPCDTDVCTIPTAPATSGLVQCLLQAAAISVGDLSGWMIWMAAHQKVLERIRKFRALAGDLYARGQEVVTRKSTAKLNARFAGAASAASPPAPRSTSASR